MALIATIPWEDGPIHVAVTEHGVVAVEQAATETAFLESIRRRRGEAARVEDAAPDDPRRPALRATIDAIEALLAGRPPASLPDLDLHDRPAWDQAVLAAVRDVPWGTTVSYGEIARRVGSPGAARAVGGAVGRNPVSLVVPCHRVIAADGSIGGYGGGTWGSRLDAMERKRRLLLREGVTVAIPDR